MNNHDNTSIPLHQKLLTKIAHYTKLDYHDTIKLVIGGIAFACIIAAYSILRSFKTAIFLGFVGKEFEPISKIISVIITFPTMVIYSKLIDSLRRHHVVYCIFGFYAIGTFVFAYLFAHPIYGIANTQTSPLRISGWAFEIFMDLFQGLVLAIFWSFLNSISTTEFATRTYGPLVAISRIGGILSSFLGWFLINYIITEKNTSIPVLTLCGGIFLILAAYCIRILYKKVPRAGLQGYAIQHHLASSNKDTKKKTSVWEGLKLMITEPYVLGIFGLVFCFEVISIIFDYQMHILMAIETHNNVTDMSSFMLLYTGAFQLLSFVLAGFGTRRLIQKLGLRICLLIMPITLIVLALCPVIYPRLATIFIVMVIIRAFNYGFNHPVKEVLYVPTVKDIQFKSKAWIDSFGRVASKGAGSSLNMIAVFSAPYICLILESAFSIGLSIVWIGIALLVGKRYNKALAQNEVIGEKK